MHVLRTPALVELTKAEMEQLTPLFESLGYVWKTGERHTQIALWEPKGKRCIGALQQSPNQESVYVLDAAYLVDVIPLLLVHAI